MRQGANQTDNLVAHWRKAPRSRPLAQSQAVDAALSSMDKFFPSTLIRGAGTQPPPIPKKSIHCGDCLLPKFTQAVRKSSQSLISAGRHRAAQNL
mmetsp:Transcript_13380/g.31402  ORF Transcript_13380/g.31402 Transcript_13380/m.31402 type:complete len:95 (-) Transcript_13380:520-804(-)